MADKYTTASRYSKQLSDFAVTVGSADDKTRFDGMYHDVWINMDYTGDPIHVVKVRTAQEAQAIASSIRTAVRRLARHAYLDGVLGNDKFDPDED